jgi:hypothetical protein
MRTPTLVAIIIVPFVLAAPASAQRTTKASPLTSTEVRAVHTAFRATLSNATVRTAVKSAVQQQLRSVPPIAFVNGNWVVPIDVAAIYNNSGVRPAIIAQLGTSSVAGRFGQIATVGVDARLGLVFVPKDLGQQLLGTSVASLRGSLAEAAFLQNTTDLMPGVTLDGAKAGMTGALVILDATMGMLGGFADAFSNWWTNTGGPKDPHTGLEMDDPNADPDGDSIPNRLDGDDDGDGTPDEDDSAPYDPGTQICFDCMGRASAAFTNVSGASVLKLAVSAHTAAASLVKANRLTSLGTLAGQNVALQIGFGTLQ